MFNPSAERPLPGASDLHGLCVSLNSPVLNIDELPVGLARAAILLYSEDKSGLRLAMALQSVETRKVVVFRHRGAVKQERARAALEVALTFGESMGFLFDEDLVKSGRPETRVHALEHWRAFLEGGEIPGPPRAGAESFLDTLDIGDDEAPLLDVLDAPSTPPLTKFREPARQAVPVEPSPATRAPQVEAKAAGGAEARSSDAFPSSRCARS
ncbi:MAG: hypothetical protein V3T33_07295 [Myxococcota bacterium]